MKNITVIGAGTMGNGIAHLFALHNYKVTLADVSEEILNKAADTIQKNLNRQLKKELINDLTRRKALSNITLSSDWTAGVSKADLIVEAITEQPDIKLDLYKKLDQTCGSHTIFASNTSSISITTIAAATKRPEQVIGMHFMNPVPVMKLVEIICGYATSETTTQAIFNLAKQLHKEPVIVNDYPGFVSNRILMPMINEAIIALYEGVSGVREIDTIMRLGMSHPMGPLQLADYIGLDVCLYIMKVLYQGLGKDKYAPCPLLINMVEAGRLGVKSGEGFYQWKSDSKELVVSDRFR